MTIAATPWLVRGHRDPPRHKMTAEELLDLGSEFDPCELVRGELILMSPPGPLHGGVTMNVSAPLHAFVRKYKLGKVYGEAGFLIERDPDTVRAPDMAFVSAARGVPDPQRGWGGVVPDLVLEVISFHDRRRDIEAKVRMWIDVGVRLAWLAAPRKRTVAVYRADGSAQVLREGDTISGEEVVPGFELTVVDAFA